RYLEPDPRDGMRPLGVAPENDSGWDLLRSLLERVHVSSPRTCRVLEGSRNGNQGPGISQGRGRVGRRRRGTLWDRLEVATRPGPQASSRREDHCHPARLERPGKGRPERSLLDDPPRRSWTGEGPVLSQELTTDIAADRRYGD